MWTGSEKARVVDSRRVAWYKSDSNFISEKGVRGMRGVVIVLVLMLGLGFSGILTTKTVEVEKVEDCAKRVGESHKEVTFLGMSWIKSSFKLADGRTVPYGDREWEPDGFGNLCRTVYVPKKQNSAIPAASSAVMDRKDNDCKEWDWDFSPPQGSIGFRCISPDDRVSGPRGIPIEQSH